MRAFNQHAHFTSMKLIEELKNNISVAVLYQAEAPPSKRGIKKPMKLGGYSDSGADIAFALNERSISVKTPSTNPSVDNDYDWIFPDTGAVSPAYFRLSRRSGSGPEASSFRGSAAPGPPARCPGTARAFPANAPC